MKTCPTCGATLDDATMFCTQCGTNLQGAPDFANTQGSASNQDTVNQDVTPNQGAANQNAAPNQGMPNQGMPNQGMPNQGPMPGQGAPYQQYAQAPVFDPYDHTAEYSPKDISDNKVIAILVYLMGTVGIIIALLASKESPYVAFHLRQGLKFLAVEVLVGIVSAVLFFTLIVPIAGGIFLVVLWVIKIICFFQICSGKAKEPAIIRSLGFLK